MRERAKTWHLEIAEIEKERGTKIDTMILDGRVEIVRVVLEGPRPRLVTVEC